MGKFALITEKRNIQLNDVRKESRKRFDELKEKNEKSAPIETGYLTIEIVENISSIKEWKKRHNVCYSMLPGIEENVYSEIGALKFERFPAQQLRICTTT